MPLQNRFGARPIWACLVAWPVHEITSFVVDSSRSRKSVFQLFKSHTSFSRHPRIEGTGQVIMQAAIFCLLLIAAKRYGFPAVNTKTLFPFLPSKSVLVPQPLVGLPRFSNPVALRSHRDIQGGDASETTQQHLLGWGALDVFVVQP